MRWILSLTTIGIVAVLVVSRVIGHGSWFSARPASHRAGFTVGSYVDSKGENHGFAVFAPDSLPKQEHRALLVFLNGTGENGDDGVRQISNNFGRPMWEMQQRFPFVCLAPQCRQGGNWSAAGPDTRAALAILDQVIEEYRINPDRVYLTGVSAGGSGVFNLAAAYPEKFAAIVPLAGTSCGRPIEEAADVYAEANLPVWNFYNGGDKDGLVSFNRRMRQELIQRGLSPIFVEYDQPGHNCWEWAYRTPAMYDWLSRQDQRQNALRQKCQLLNIEPSLSDWQSGSKERWFSEEGVLHVNSNHQSGTSSTLMYKATFENFELHFDYRSDEGQGFEVVLQSAADASDEVRILIAWPEMGTRNFSRTNRMATRCRRGDSSIQQLCKPELDRIRRQGRTAKLS